MKHLTKLLSTLTLLLGLTTAMIAQEAASAVELYNEGLAKLKAKEYDAALDLMKQALEAVDPESETDVKVESVAKKNGPIAAFYSGNAARKAEDFDKALAAYDDGIAMNPGFYGNYLGRAQALDGKGEDVLAVTAFIEAGEMAEKSPKNAPKAQQYYSKAEKYCGIAYGKKEYDQAIALGEAFLAKRETADAYYYTAAAQLKTNKASDALAHATKAAEMGAESEDSGKYYMLKGEVLEALGQKSEAVAAFKMISSGKYAERAKYKIDQLNK